MGTSLAAVLLLGALVAQSTAQLSFSPVFPISQYDTDEGQDVVIRLSETILTTPGIPAFTGTICVDVIAEDLADTDTFRGATFLSDYIVNIGNASSRIFTVCFQPLQSNSSVHTMHTFDDSSLEGRECFRLRLVEVRFTGSAADLFIPQQGLSNTFADVCIEDNDIVQVNWTISRAITVTEGDPPVRLRGEAFGIYANEIAIGVVCSETIATDVEPAFPVRDFNFTLGTKLHFTEVGEPQSTSVDEVIIPIINDGIAEPRESFICTLQGGIVDTLQVIFPSQVTIEIRDDDELIVRWATDFYEFQESEVATVELVTDSDFEISRITILGFPEAIPEGSPKRKTSLSVPGPRLSGFTFDATIKQAQFGGTSYGAAEVTQAGRTDVLQTINDFVFTPASKSAFGNFSIVNEPTDGVLECDELFQAEFSFGPEIENNWNVRKGTPSITCILIRDDDSVTVTFNEESYSVTESEGQVSVSLRIDGKFFKPVYAIIEVSDGTATAPGDYTSAILYNVTFRQTTFQDSGTPTDTAISETIYINITDDDILEGLEYFQVRIVETSDRFRVRIGQDTVNVTIIDDDSVVVRYDKELYQLQEEEGFVTLGLVLEGDAVIDVTVSVNTLDLLNSTVGDAATAILDYLNITSVPLAITFPAGSKQQSYNVTIEDDSFPENSEFFNADVNAIPQVTPHVGPSVIIGSPKQPLIEILDEIDQEVEIFLDQTAYCIFENEITVTVTLRLSDVYRENITVNVTVGELQGIEALLRAQADVDFSTTGFPQQVTIPTEQTSVQFTVTVIDDAIVEKDEQFQLSFTYSGTQTGVIVRPGFDQANITIKNDDAITVQFTQNMYTVRESDGMVDVVVMASGRTSFAYMFTVTPMDITAMNNVDYNFSTTTYEFPPADANQPIPSTVISILIIPDDENEFDETFKLTIVVSDDARTCNVTEGQISMTEVLIIDDDDVTVNFCPQNYTIPEGFPAEVMICLDKPSVNNFTITVTTMDITAQSPDDYSGGSFNVFVPAGTTKVTLSVATLTDNFVEVDEFFKATLSLFGAPEAVIVGSPDMAFVTINDTNVLIPVRFNPSDYIVTEGVDSNAVITLEALEGHPDFAFTVNVNTQDGTATRGSDYEGTTFLVTFPAGVNVVSFNVTIIDDNIAELAESFTCDLMIPAASAAMGVIEGSPNTSTVNIMDDEVVVISFIPQNYTVLEGTPADIMIVLDKPSPMDITITVTTMDITAIDPDDYTGGSFDVLIPAGTVKVTLPVSTLTDNFVEPDEYFKATLSLPGAQDTVVVGSPDMAFVTITDTTLEIPVRFIPSNYTVREGTDSNAVITLEALGDHPDFAFTVNVNTQDGTAIRGSDYEGTTFPVTFPAGVNVVSFNVTIINDNIAELTESFTLDLEIPAASAAMGVINVSPDTANINIMDDDELIISFSPQNYTVPEGDPADIMIVLTQPSPVDINITVTTMDITAEDPDDYTGGSFTVLIPAETVKVTLPVSTLTDNFVEPDEYFKATLSLPDAPAVAVVGSPDMAFITIIDANMPIPVRFNPSNYTVKEGADSNAVITLEALSDHPDFAFTVNVVTQDGTATRGSDYEGTTFPVTFPAGVNVVSFNVTIINDMIAECAKLFTLDLEIPAASAAMGIMLGSPDTATVNIMDDDVEQLMLSIENADYSVKEDDGSFTAAVTASREADFTYTVSVVTVDGSAVDVNDYQSAQFDLAFPVGQTSAEFQITIVDDNVIEEMETFEMQLSIPDDITAKGVQVGPNAVSTVTIMDNDVQVKFSRDLIVITEEDGEAEVIVEAMGDLTSDFSIIVMAINGTAMENNDFTGNMWQVDFVAGQTESGFMIPIVQDSVAEDTEEFSLKIVIDPPLDQRVTVGEPSMQTVMITDIRNDTGRGDPLFSIPLPSKYINDAQLKNIQLCFEVHGVSGNHYNLISDTCTSVSTTYSKGVVDTSMNVMTEIGIKTQGGNGTCHSIEVDLNGCSAFVDGVFRNTTNTITVNSISVTIRRQRVRVSLPNCDTNKELTLWMLCTKRHNEDMLEVVVARGDGLEPTAHGLIGQFWNIPLTIVPYVGPYGDGTVDESDRKYTITVSYPGAPERSFVADYGKRDWLDNRHCLYSGNRDAGPSGEVKGSESVIEGKASDYVVGELFSTDFVYSKYNDKC